MTNKAKILLAEYTRKFIRPANLRFAEMWKLQTVEAFLCSGLPINKKGIKAYISTLGTTSRVSPVDAEGVLLELIKIQNTKNEETVLQPAKSKTPTASALTESAEQSLTDFNKWLTLQQEFSVNTARSYTHSARQYLSIYSSVSQKEVVAYKKHLLSTGLSLKTINIKISGVASYGKFLGKKIEVKRLRVPRAFECNNVPSEEEMAIFLEKTKEINRYWYLVARCLSTTGLRVHELQKLIYQDILDGHAVLIGKGGKLRRVFFQSQFIDEIKEYLKDKNLIPAERFCTKTTRGIAQQIHIYSAKAGLDVTKFHPHAFRHYFAKQYLKSNPTDIIGLQNLLGHSSIETTAIYLQRSYEEQLNDFQKNVTWS